MNRWLNTNDLTRDPSIAAFASACTQNVGRSRETSRLASVPQETGRPKTCRVEVAKR
jgi:hypothetical protein